MKCVSNLLKSPNYVAFQSLGANLIKALTFQNHKIIKRNRWTTTIGCKTLELKNPRTYGLDKIFLKWFATTDTLKITGDSVREGVKNKKIKIFGIFQIEGGVLRGVNFQ